MPKKQPNPLSQESTGSIVKTTMDVISTVAQEHVLGQLEHFNSPFFRPLHAATLLFDYGSRLYGGGHPGMAALEIGADTLIVGALSAVMPPVAAAATATIVPRYGKFLANQAHVVLDNPPNWVDIPYPNPIAADVYTLRESAKGILAVRGLFSATHSAAEWTRTIVDGLWNTAIDATADCVFNTTRSFWSSMTSRLPATAYQFRLSEPVSPSIPVWDISGKYLQHSQILRSSETSQTSRLLTITERNPMPTQTPIQLDTRSLDTRIQLISTDIAQSMALAQRKQALMPRIAALQHQLAETPKDEETPSATIASYANDLGHIATAVGAFAQAIGSRKAGALEGLGKNAILLSKSIDALSAAGAVLNIAMACNLVVSVVGIVSSLSSLFSDDDSTNEALEAIMRDLRQIAQQIMELGQHIDQRFDDLEKTIAANHKDLLQHLREACFKTALTQLASQELLRDQHGAVMTRLQDLMTQAQAILSSQRTESEDNLRRHCALLDDMHYLQGQPNLRVVNTVLRLLGKKIDSETFAKYSGKLFQAITMESHGSTTLTGANLRVDDIRHMAAMRSQLLIPLAECENPQDVLCIAANNIELLRAVALKHDSAARIDRKLPHLVLFINSILAFDAWHQDYIKDKDLRVIPQDTYTELSGVIDSIATVNGFLQSMDLKKITSAQATLLQSEFIKLNEEVSNEITKFEEDLTDDFLTKHLEYLENMKKLLPYAQNLEMTFADNSTFKIEMVEQIGSRYPRVLLFLDQSKIAFSSPLGSIESRGIERRWDKFDYKSFLEYLLSTKVGFASVFGLSETVKRAIGSNRWHLRIPETVPPGARTAYDLSLFSAISLLTPQTRQDLERALATEDWQKLLVPEDKPRWLEVKKLHYKNTIDRQLAKINALQDKIRQLQTRKSKLNIFARSQDSTDSLKSIAVFGPRIIKPSPASELGLILLLDNSELFDKFIPRSILMAEVLGLGKIEFTYTAAFTNKQQSIQDFEFALKIEFVPTITAQPSIILFEKSITERGISSTYTGKSGLEEVIYSYWNRVPFLAKVLDLTCTLFKDLNPIQYRMYRDNLILSSTRDAVVTQAIYDQAGLLGQKLIQDRLKIAQHRCNQHLRQAITLSDSTLHQLSFKIEISIALIRLFSGLLLPSQQAQKIYDILKIEYLKESDFIHDGHAITTNLAETLVKLEDLSQNLIRVIDEAQRAGNIGLKELEALQNKLIEYQKTLVKPQLMSAAASVAGGVVTGASVVVRRHEEDAPLHELVARQSEQISELTAQNRELNAKLDMVLGLLMRMAPTASTIQSTDASTASSGASASSGVRPLRLSAGPSSAAAFVVSSDTMPEVRAIMPVLPSDSAQLGSSGGGSASSSVVRPIPLSVVASTASTSAAADDRARARAMALRILKHKW